MPDRRLAYLPRPVQLLSGEALRSLADGALEQLVVALTAPPGDRPRPQVRRDGALTPCSVSHEAPWLDPGGSVLSKVSEYGWGDWVTPSELASSLTSDRSGQSAGEYQGQRTQLSPPIVCTVPGGSAVAPAQSPRTSVAGLRPTDAGSWATARSPHCTSSGGRGKSATIGARRFAAVRLRNAALVQPSELIPGWTAAKLATASATWVAEPAICPIPSPLPARRAAGRRLAGTVVVAAREWRDSALVGAEDLSPHAPAASAIAAAATPGARRRNEAQRACVTHLS